MNDIAATYQFAARKKLSLGNEYEICALEHVDGVDGMLITVGVPTVSKRTGKRKFNGQLRKVAITRAEFDAAKSEVSP